MMLAFFCLFTPGLAAVVAGGGLQTF